MGCRAAARRPTSSPRASSEGRCCAACAMAHQRVQLRGSLLRNAGAAASPNTVTRGRDPVVGGRAAATADAGAADGSAFARTAPVPSRGHSPVAAVGLLVRGHRFVPACRDADSEPRPHDQPDDRHGGRRLGSQDHEQRAGEQHDLETQSSRISESSGGTRRDPASPRCRRHDREADTEDRGTQQRAPTLPSPHPETDQHAELGEEPDGQERQHGGSVGTSRSVRREDDGCAARAVGAPPATAARPGRPVVPVARGGHAGPVTQRGSGTCVRRLLSSHRTGRVAG